ncbi:hypothetical protein J6590_046385 [Homalodisca vitripennis]|nr:hypothetical protein J6590_046385 [Homalodisca vitripennis]
MNICKPDTVGHMRPPPASQSSLDRASFSTSVGTHFKELFFRPLVYTSYAANIKWSIDGIYLIPQRVDLFSSIVVVVVVLPLEGVNLRLGNLSTRGSAVAGAPMWALQRLPTE